MVTKKGNKYEGVIYKRTLISPKSKGTPDFGKVYIGQTDNMAERETNWNKIGNHNYGGRKITDARNQYGVGKDAWSFEIVEKVFADTPSELKTKLQEKETEYITKYNSVEHGFNGSYGNGMQGMKHSAASKEKISKNHRHYQTNKTKKKISKSQKGKKVSFATREKIRIANTGKKRSLEQRAAMSNSRKGKEPLAASQGLKAYCAQHGHGPTKGITQSPEARLNMKKAQQARGINTIVLFPDGTEKIFPTMLDAAKAAGVGVGSVFHCIKSGGKTKNGFQFRQKEKAA